MIKGLGHKRYKKKAGLVRRGQQSYRIASAFVELMGSCEKERGVPGKSLGAETTMCFLWTTDRLRKVEQELYGEQEVDETPGHIKENSFSSVLNPHAFLFDLYHAIGPPSTPGRVVDLFRIKEG